MIHLLVGTLVHSFGNPNEDLYIIKFMAKPEFYIKFAIHVLGFMRLFYYEGSFCIKINLASTINTFHMMQASFRQICHISLFFCVLISNYFYVYFRYILKFNMTFAQKVISLIVTIWLGHFSLQKSLKLNRQTTFTISVRVCSLYNVIRQLRGSTMQCPYRIIWCT